MKLPENIKGFDSSKIWESAPVCLLITFTFFAFGPIELYLSNSSVLWFSFAQLLSVVLAMFLTGFILLLAVLYVIPQIVGRYIKAFILGLGAALYIQGNFMPVSYGDLDGQAINWGQYGTWGIINICIWIIVLILPFLLIHRKNSLYKKIEKTLPLFITAIQFVTIVTMLFTGGISSKAAFSLTTNKMFELSPNKNIVVFVIDTFDATYMDNLLIKYPEYEGYLKDFTYYDNVIGMYPTTRGAVPHLLTGQINKNELPVRDYINKAFQSAHVYPMMKEYNYSIGLYSGTGYVDRVCDEYLENTVLAQPGITSKIAFSTLLSKFTAFKYFPHYLKKYVWIYTEEFDKLRDSIGTHPLYQSDDSIFYQQLLNDRISVAESGNAYRFYHTKGVHQPYTFDENTIPYPKNVYGDHLTSTRGCFNVIREYIDQLKENGIYDNTMIFIMADHGHLSMSQHPAVLIKQWGDQKDFSVSRAPLSYSNFIPTIEYAISGQVGDGTPFFFTQEDDNVVRSFFHYQWNSNNNPKFLSDIIEYEAYGAADDLARFRRTGRIFAHDGERDIEIAPYTVGESISAANENIEDYIIFGIGGIEGSVKRWSDYYSSEMLMDLGEKPGTNLELKMNFGVFGGKNGYQHLTLYANDQLVGEKLFYSNDTFGSLIIPKDVFTDSTLRLRFEYPEANSPFLINGSGDNRILAFSFRSFQLIPTNKNPDSEQTRILNGQNSINEIIEFQNGSDSMQALLEGWHSTEGSHRWSSQLASLEIFCNNKSDLLLFVQGRRFAPSGETRVMVNGHMASTIGNSESAPYRIVIPVELLSEEGRQIITFSTPGAVSPLVAGEGSETRVFGMDFNWIWLYQMNIDEGCSIDFTKNGSSDLLKLEGWHPTEETMTWTNRLAEFMLLSRQDDLNGKDIQLTIDYAKYQYSGDTVLLLNGTEVGNLDPNATTANIILKNKLFLPDSEQTISFLTHDAISPKDMGESGDERVLGIAIKSISFAFEEK